MCQELQNINSKISDIRPSKRTYISDELGNLFININIWGIEESGLRSIPEGSTIIDVLSATGGVKIGYDYKNIIILRESTQNKQNQKFKIDISEFLKTGNRKNLTKILPNDIIIIKQKFFYSLIERVGEFSTFLNLLVLMVNLASF
tara:strand:+ start:957 stop:1394 length:438 start_codon:yes stop_codon:yes gene_type:complete